MDIHATSALSETFASPLTPGPLGTDAGDAADRPSTGDQSPSVGRELSALLSGARDPSLSETQSDQLAGETFDGQCTRETHRDGAVDGADPNRCAAPLSTVGPEPSAHTGGEGALVQEAKPKRRRGGPQPIDPADVNTRPIGKTPDPADLQSSREDHVPSEVGLLIELWRQRQDLRRAEQRLGLQCQAICRRACGGDKELGGDLWTAVQREPESNPSLSAVLSPYAGAMASLAVSAKALEHQVVLLVRETPLWRDWGAGIRGIAELSVGGLIGEAGRPLAEYRSVSAIWKRFGLAVIDGGRQRLVAGEAALVHGYAPRRRAYAYVLSTNLMRSQRAGDPYREIYDSRKAYELERGVTKAHAHNRALRVMVKALLRDAYLADRRAAA